MMKNCFLVLALLSLALAGGCAKGGNGIVPFVSVSPNNVSPNQIYPGQTVTLTASTTNPAYAPVTWSLSGPGSITGSTPPDAANKISAMATYAAPTTVGAQATITATLVSDTAQTGNAALTVADVTTQVGPLTTSVGSGLTQAFVATAIPADAPPTYTWTCTANGNPCANFAQDPNTSGLAYYTSADNCTGSTCVQISAASTLDPTGCAANPKNCTIAKVAPVTSRVSGTYGFRFSGYDSSNHAVAIVGTFTASANGNNISGSEELLTATGPSGQNPISITGGAYAPASGDLKNSNNAGTLTLTLPGGIYPRQFDVVLDGAGDLEMIESDGHGSGAGLAQIAAASGVFKGDQTFAFGFTGVDSGGNRVGYVGVLPMNGSGVIASGQMDVNDDGMTSNICGTSPCAVAGSYAADGGISGLWHMTLTTAVTQHFDFFLSAGSSSKTSPLTFYAISTDAVDATHPAVSGSMVLQDSSQTYNIAALTGVSVSALTGVDGANTVVSLTLGNTDGKGGFSGQYDQNDAGTILSAIAFPGTSTAYTYAASTTNGRYTFNLLGNPGASTVVAPLPFVLYASGQNRGFLLDQKSTAVMTGTMNPQGKGSGAFGTTELPGTFGAATTSMSNASASPLAANLLLSGAVPSTNALCGNGSQPNCPLTGTQYPGGAGMTGTYVLGGTAGTGVGTVALTAPGTQTYAIYAVDTAGCAGQSVVCAITDFFMIDEDKTTKSPTIIFAKE